MGKDGVEQTYFTCTLGEAARRRRVEAESEDQPTFESIIDLLEKQAQRIPQSEALGFANFLREGDDPRPVTFLQLNETSKVAAQALSRHVTAQRDSAAAPVAGLLCTSSMDFMLTYLGLLRLGFSVLFLAPQLEPRAIQHLCETLGAELILVDKRHEAKATSLMHAINVLDIPDYSSPDSSPDSISDLSSDTVGFPQISPIACFFHTSGTSSGLPKPIPQSHGMVSTLPVFTHPGQPATFVTTPLYHGGLADCIRAWTSGAAIWLYPEGAAPITAANVCRAVQTARDAGRAEIQYFGAVPYILQMLAEDRDGGLEVLQSMDLVSVGGAALTPAVGDRLVDDGVRLVSRMGSTECGFLMSSHRDYDRDKEWQYLRPVNDSSLLCFEPRDDGLAELVVKPDWPFLAKTNRPDGSFATSDLFEAHASIPNAWRYHSRADAQITLSNGKKFDPAPVEASILASSALLQDVLVFGNEQEYAGALLFPAGNQSTSDDIIGAVWPTVQKMNDESQSHARITKQMLVTVPFQDGEKPLEKSSKGTILRKQAEARYADSIRAAYDDTSKAASSSSLADEDLFAQVMTCFSGVLGRDIDPETDLYQQGVDSISCIQVRKMIESSCLDGAKLPMSILYDQGSVNALVDHLRDIRQNGTDNTSQKDKEEEASLRLMQTLSEKYSDFRNVALGSRGETESRKVVVLTGATGFLGAHMLDLLRQDDTVAKVICLLRAQTPFAAHERVDKALYKRGMSGLEEFDESTLLDTKVVCLCARLADANLGLDEQHLEYIKREASVFIHAAWTVNFTLRLKSFEDQVCGTRNMADLALESGSDFVFISSTAAVISSDKKPIPEAVSHDPKDASPLGYSQSKWVAEQVCRGGNNHLNGHSYGHSDNDLETPGKSSSRVSIVRVGQLCGNEAGVWNVSEAYPLMLSTATITGCLPDLPHEVLNWLPVEVAAKSVIDCAFLNGTSTTQTPVDGSSQEMPIYHVLNPHLEPSWSGMLEELKRADTNAAFDIVPVRTWLDRLEKALASEHGNHPSQALLGLWQHSFSLEATSDEPGVIPEFDLTRTRRDLASMRHVKPLDGKRVLNMWKWVNENVGK